MLGRGITCGQPSAEGGVGDGPEAQPGCREHRAPLTEVVSRGGDKRRKATNAFGLTERMVSEGQWLEMPLEVQWPRAALC